MERILSSDLVDPGSILASRFLRIFAVYVAEIYRQRWLE